MSIVILGIDLGKNSCSVVGLNASESVVVRPAPDGQSRLELSRFLTPSAVAGHRNAPVNALGYRLGNR